MSVAVDKVHEYEPFGPFSIFTMRTSGGWTAEVRREMPPGYVIGLKWGSGFYLTRWGAKRALQAYIASGGNPHAETLRRFGLRARGRLRRVAQ